MDLLYIFVQIPYLLVFYSILTQLPLPVVSGGCRQLVSVPPLNVVVSRVLLRAVFLLFLLLYGLALAFSVYIIYGIVIMMIRIFFL